MAEQSLFSEIDIRFLIITARGFAWIETLRNSAAQVELVRDPQACEMALSTQEFDIVLYDDTTFTVATSQVIEELHLQNPHALIAVISDDLSQDYYEGIIAAGGADAILSSVDMTMMLQRLSVLVRQQQKNNELASRTRHLHAINLLSQKLHHSAHPTMMIVDALELICNYFDVAAVVITIAYDGYYHLHAGTNGERRRIYDTKIELERENPLRQTIDSRLSLIFGDIQRHPYYQPIPTVKAPKAAVIVPIKYGTEILGSLALFRRNGIYTVADVAVFELLGSNFGTAYHTIAEQYLREIDVQSMQYVLAAWPALNGVYTKSDIVRVIHDHVLDIETIKVVGVWLFWQLDADDAVIYSEYDALQACLITLRDEGHLDVISAQFADGVSPITFQKHTIKLKMLKPLFEVLASDEFTLMPIAGNSFEGLIILANQGSQSISSSDMSLIENLSRVTANVLERNTLIESIQEERLKLQEQTGRVEGVLRSIDEGIFFVDDSHQVVYCNPQFTELTAIAPSQILDEPFSKLFQLLSQLSSEQVSVYEHLMQAVAHVEGQGADDAYPFVEIASIARTDMIVEFMRVDTYSEQSGWIGVISAGDGLASSSAKHKMLQNMLEDMSLPIIDLNNTVMSLPQQYDLLSAGNFEALLQRLEMDVQHMQSMWSNFVQIYKGEIEGIQIRSTTVEPSHFIESLLTNRRMLLYRRQIRFDKQTVDALIHVDERQMRQCFINVVEFLASVSSEGAPIFVEIVADGQHVVFSVQEKTTLLPQSELTNIFKPQRDMESKDALYPHRLGMYLARQIVEAHGGQLNIINTRGLGLSVKVALPLVSDDDTDIPIIEEENVVAYKQQTKGLTMIVAESASFFLRNLYPKIEAQGHEIIIEQNLDGVLFDLKMVKVDIILIEVDRSNLMLVGQVQRIRAQSEVPIVIITLPDFEDECLQALAHGADDYFIVPFNEEKLLAQLFAISKRQELASRTAEPIRVGDLEIDFSRRRVYLGGELIDLTAKEYELLRVLAMNRGQVMSHQRLLAKVWGPEHDNETQYLWVNISRLRRKLEPHKDSPRYIQNEPRVGYVFVPDMD
ncbi:MAG: winged helix-turn-helix domain-containing protein [Phototrophicaceae bacterium]